MSSSPDAFRAVMRRWPSGVTVITGTTPEGAPAGVTISAFSSLSLNPPLVLFCLGREAQCREAFGVGRTFAVHILAEGQEDLSAAFAARTEDRFAGVAHRLADDGCPVLDGCLAVLRCRSETVHVGGDHLVVIGQVQHIDNPEPERRPLLHYRGAYGRLG